MGRFRRRSLRVAQPCAVPWSSMTGDERVRHCSRCDRDVHSLGALTRDEAERLAATGICGEYVPDAEGEPLLADRTVTAPCRAPVLAAVLLASCATHLEADDLDPMENIAVAPPPEVIPRASEAPPAGDDGEADVSEATAEHDHDAECDRDHEVFHRGIVVSPSEFVILEKVYFHEGSASVPAEAGPILDEIVDVLAQNPGIRQLLIVGHTDDGGSERSRERMAQRRAAAVRDYLRDHGIAPERLSIAGRGGTQPVASNTTPEGRASNRRVEFEITDQVGEP